jgi:hypothetical protein
MRYHSGSLYALNRQLMDDRTEIFGKGQTMDIGKYIASRGR